MRHGLIIEVQSQWISFFFNRDLPHKTLMLYRHWSQHASEQRCRSMLMFWDAASATESPSIFCREDSSLQLTKLDFKWLCSESLVDLLKNKLISHQITLSEDGRSVITSWYVYCSLCALTLFISKKIGTCCSLCSSWFRIHFWKWSVFHFSPSVLSILGMTHNTQTYFNYIRCS